MARGDHFFVWRHSRGVPFQHHGIDLGDGTVVHFTDGDDGVAGPGRQHEDFEIRRTSVDVVSPGGRDKLHVVLHQNSLAADEVVRRAMSQVGRRGYHFVFDNCEHFANWCVVGRNESRQIDELVQRVGAAGAKAVAAGVLRTASGIGARRVLRGAAPLMLAADAAQWATEAGGHHLGLRDPQHRKNAGRAVGLTTAMGVGSLAGPAGIVVAGGIWVAGEFAGELSSRTVKHASGLNK